LPVPSQESEPNKSPHLTWQFSRQITTRYKVENIYKNKKQKIPLSPVSDQFQNSSEK
jgi:hypothetical protein